MLEGYRIDGQLVFDPAKPDDQRTLARILSLKNTMDREPADLIKDTAFSPIFKDASELEDFRIRSRAQMEAACRARSADAITDDNLGHEYRWWQ